jgi:hypothetical protein
MVIFVWIRKKKFGVGVGDVGRVFDNKKSAGREAVNLTLRCWVVAQMLARVFHIFCLIPIKQVTGLRRFPRVFISLDLLPLFFVKFKAAIGAEEIIITFYFSKTNMFKNKVQLPIRRTGKKLEPIKEIFSNQVELSRLSIQN